MVSARFRELRSNIENLRTYLLPSQFSPTGEYPEPEAVSVKALSFRAFVHAEIESYLEERCLEVCVRAWDAWTSARQTSLPLVALLCFSGTLNAKPATNLEKTQAKLNEPEWAVKIDPGAMIQKAQAAYRAAINGNHGIKEGNVLALLLPIGADHNSLDTVALATLNTLGKSRGSAVHTSYTRVASALDPKEEYTVAQSILVQLEPIDLILENLLAKIPVGTVDSM